LANFDEGSLAILLPLVLPQFILGMMLGYLRVRFALWAAILLHAAHNATALAIAAIAGQLS
jgi:membrane protease YdiL (CAAX protease family)